MIITRCLFSKYRACSVVGGYETAELTGWNLVLGSVSNYLFYVPTSKHLMPEIPRFRN